MNHATAHMLIDLTSDFYRRVSASFSETRQAAWAGWQHACDVCADACHPAMRVLDLGCGNLRFERFLMQSAGGFGEAHAFDNCEELTREGKRQLESEGASVFLHRLDIAQALMSAVEGAAESTVESAAGITVGSATEDTAKSTAEATSGSTAETSLDLGISPCDLSVAFGFAHHLPTPGMRACMLRTLVSHTRPGGYVVVSFWQFANDDKLRAKAERVTERGCAELGITLGTDDYLLGWQSEQHLFRFCHHFEDAEIDQLAQAVSANAIEVARFSADGKTGNLNRYLILRVVEA